ncbi:tetratricopeptide repeat-containing sensor histidine kinase [Ignavibacterium sp.]|uniref:tetratricopeptide repeat-containing sensor histidine kinase n=1 Tax=Ignavibacterium sp. TaxID=2651167 RepID=UPI00220C058B|nr:tetratricopeptide repeat-containing sensor histidine kinase [Ignavibacterium sp.]BDQ03460.1 MAG: histidine kinase [Ignavibacterium sp.]
MGTKSKNPFIFLIIYLLLLNLSLFAQTNIDSLINLAEKSEGKEKISLLIKLGYYLGSDNPAQAIKYLDEAISLSDKLNLKGRKADALFNKGVALWHLGNIPESENYYSQAKVIYEELKDTLSLIKLYNSEAINYSMRGRSDIALEIFLKSLDYANKINDRPTIFNTLFNIGIVFDNRGEFDKAIEHYNKSLQYADDKGSKALVENYLAEIYLTRKDLKKAEEFLNRAILDAEASGDINSQIWSYTNLGSLNFERGNLTEAEKNFNSALELSRKSEYKLDIIHSLTELGKFYFKTKRLKEAEKYLLEAFDIANQINSVQDLSNITNVLKDVYAELNNYKQAFEFLKLNKQYSDTLQAINQNEKILEIETKYAVKQKEKEAQLLKNENELQKKVIETQKLIAIVVSVLGLFLVILIALLIRSRRKILAAQKDLIMKNEEIELSRKEIAAKNKELEILNSTKDKFFSIIAHDLRNPIAGFVSISDILETDYDRISDQEKKSLLSQMNNSSKNLIALLENLLTWARLSSNKIEVVRSKSKLSELIFSAVSPYEHWAKSKRVNLRIEIPEDKKIETDPFIFQTVVGNLINNAIKFSNSGDTVSVIAKLENGKIRLSVKDNGVGIPEHRLKNIFGFDNKKTTKGTMNESGTGLGLVLVKELSDKMNWQIEVHSQPQLGSEFILNIFDN